MGKTQTEANYVFTGRKWTTFRTSWSSLEGSALLTATELECNGNGTRGHKYLSGGGAMGRLGVPRLTNMLDKPLGPSPVRLPNIEARWP